MPYSLPVSWIMFLGALWAGFKVGLLVGHNPRCDGCDYCGAHK
jgi:hypothetical protein